MFVLCSYKILNSHDIYKDTFIQVLHYIHYNRYIKLITLLYQTKIIFISCLATCQFFPFLGDFEVLNEIVRMWKILSQPQRWMK